MIRTRRTSSIPHSPRAGFTLIELLIVLAIIGLLAAILFPAFKSAQERSAQANCASNLKQIYTAVELYRADEKVYPASLAFLLPDDSKIDGGTAGGDPNTGGTGFFKGGRDSLLCPDDDTDASLTRSSYGDISYDITAGDKSNMSRYIWNYWGYRAIDNTTTCKDGTTDVSECAGTAYQSATSVKDAETAAGAGWDATLLMDPTNQFNHRTSSAYDDTRPENVLKYSLANRFAPTSTIITHCVYHRLPTASGKLAFPYEMTIDSEAGALARDIVLRRDGSAKVLDVSKFDKNANWAKQNF